jgi:3-dehydroquinate dehydratase-2
MQDREPQAGARADGGMRPTVYVLNGPNLNLLGVREPDLYGRRTLADLEAICRQAAEDEGWDLAFRQSNHEAEIVGWLGEARGRAVGVVLNPAAYCYTSRPILEALRGLRRPVVEVHITNIHAREPWRTETITAAACRGLVSGLGLEGYALAIAYLGRLARAGTSA